MRMSAELVSVPRSTRRLSFSVRAVSCSLQGNGLTMGCSVTVRSLIQPERDHGCVDHAYRYEPRHLCYHALPWLQAQSRA